MSGLLHVRDKHNINLSNPHKSTISSFNHPDTDGDVLPHADKSGRNMMQNVIAY
jgi:hypothetical protein